jgi:hypothetical protein
LQGILEKFKDMTVESTDLDALFQNSLALDWSQWTSHWSACLGSAHWNMALWAAMNQDHGACERALPCSDSITLWIVETKATSPLCQVLLHQMPIGCQNLKSKFGSENSNFCSYCYHSPTW